MIKQIRGSFVEWCAKVLESDEHVILDTETTGLKTNDQVIELAIIGTSCEVLFNELLKPSCEIGEAAASVHHITESMLEDKPCFKDRWPEIERAIGGLSIITWHAAFDARMIQQTSVAHNVFLKNIDYYCAMIGYTNHYRFAKWTRLTEACAQQGVDFRQDHRALGDVMATLEIIRTMAKKAVKA